MERRVSVVIPNYNGSASVGKCLESVFSSGPRDLEVIVVDDCSSDNSVDIIRRFPCKLIQLDRRSGASKARNTGARNATGDVLFFIDSDCILQENTLTLAAAALKGDEHVVYGGSYTPLPYDDDFFSTFQSIFVNYSETKRGEPDYIATHAMVISRRLFEKSGGFPEHFFPILEDVEFSHRLRRSGCTLRMNPDLLVRHMFNFTFMKSLRNAFRKTRYWTAYSLMNRDLLTDSGTASAELKTAVVSFFVVILLLVLSLFSGSGVFVFLIIPVLAVNFFINRSFIAAMFRTKGALFTLMGIFYYMAVYPLAVGAGAAAGILEYIKTSGQIWRTT